MVERRNPIGAQLLIGCAIVVLGVLFTLENLNVLESEPILRWWPMVVVLIGLTKLLGFGARPQTIAGALITAAGLWMLIASLDLIRYGIWDLWPLALVFGGGWLVLRGLNRTRRGGPAVDPDEYANAFVMLGGVVRKMSSTRFRGGEATAFMGGVELDLRDARPASDTVVIDVLAWWGGIELWVPTDWKVTSEVVPFMAGYEDKTKPRPDATTHLIVRGFVVMGGIDIGN